jgi:hypothetical protein
VSFAAVTLCFASQRVFIVVSVYFVIDPVRKRLDTHNVETGTQTNAYSFSVVQVVYTTECNEAIKPRHEVSVETSFPVDVIELQSYLTCIINLNVT